MGSSRRILLLTALLALSVCLPVSAADILMFGDLGISGSLTLSGKGIIFPDSTVQNTAAFAYASTVVVSPVGSESENRTSLLSKLSSIKDASQDKPFLLKN